MGRLLKKGGKYLLRGLLCIRFEEVFVFTAIPLFGYLTAILSVAGHATVSSSLLVFLGSFCTMAGTFLINDYAGLKEDKQDQSKKHQPSIRLKARGGELLMAFLFTSFLGTISFASLGKTIAAKKTLVVTSMGFVYSNPVQTCQVKRIPFFATLMHVVGAVFSFQLGFSAVGAVHRGIDYIGLYIGFLVAGGHFLQEIHDNDGDSMNKIPTTAVLLGVERTFFLAATFFTTANVFIFGIVQQKWVSLGGASWAILCLWVSTCFFTVIHFYLVWSTGLTQTDIHRLRKKTRATILPLMMALTMIVEPGFRLRTESSLMTSDSLPSWDLGNQGALSNITEKVSSDLGVEIEKVTMKNIATEDELVSILVPVFNEASTVESTVLSLAVVSHPHEVIIINDGSTDETFSILNSSAPLWKEKIPMLQELRIIQLASNRGKGMAIREGFKVSKGSIIVLQDADAEYNADDIIILITPLLLEPELRFDAVYGTRFGAPLIQDPSYGHRLANRVLTVVCNLLNGIALTDVETGYKAIRRETMEKLVLREEGFVFEVELTVELARSKAMIAEVPTHYQPRSHAEGKKIGAKDGIVSLIWLLKNSMWL